MALNKKIQKFIPIYLILLLSQLINFIPCINSKVNKRKLVQLNGKVVEELKPLDQRIPHRCPFSFKIYIYPLPPYIPPVKLAEEARKNRTFHVCQRCIYEQFSLEYIAYDYFSQFCGRTLDPEEADYFYVPVVRDVEYRQELTRNIKRASLTDNVFLTAIEKKDLTLWRNYLNITAKYWERNNGADHIIVMPAPVTNFRHESGNRGFFHYMIHLNNPIFINVEYSRLFVKEYPVCATEKNIVMPYPNTDPDMISGKLMNEPVRITRNKLIYYQGGSHGSCVDIRTALNELMRDKNIAPQAGPKKREMGFRQSVFCPIPVGDSPSSKRQYDVMNFGCIPVVLSDEMLYAFTEITGGGVREANFSLRFPQKIVQKPAHILISEVTPQNMGYLPSGLSMYSVLQTIAEEAKANNATVKAPRVLVELLSRVPAADVAALQLGVAKVSRKYRYYALNSSTSEIPTSVKAFPDGGAMRILSRLLDLRKEKGILDISNRCKLERERTSPKHVYIGNYPCEATKKHARRKSRRMFIADNKYVDDNSHITFSYVNNSNGTYDLEGKRIMMGMDINSATVGLFARSDKWVF